MNDQISCLQRFTVMYFHVYISQAITVDMYTSMVEQEG